MRPVTLGVLLDSRIQEGWVLESLRQALAVPGVRLAAVALAARNTRVSFASRLHRVLDRIDRQLRCRNEPLFVAADVPAELAMPLLEVTVVRHRDGWSLDEAGIAALRRPDVDVWLCFAASPPRRRLSSVARIGVWGIEIGQSVSATNAWAGAIEVGAGSPVTRVSLVDYWEPGDGLLYRSFGATVTNSARCNRLQSLRIGLSFFGRLLVQLTRHPESSRCARSTTLAEPECYPALREPTFPAVARLTWRLVSTVAANRWRSLGARDQWQIAYDFGDEDAASRRLERLRYLSPPKEHFWADPFAIEHQGRYFIFFEELSYRTQKGRIMAIEVFEDAEPGEARVVLERPYHLSYPFLFAWGDALYMLPETAENRTIEVYRCESFPLRWSLHQVLLENISAFDATLWQDKERWWMFVNVAEPGTTGSDELHLYSGPTPFGPWTAHRGNPVVSDVRSARSAGPLFSSNDVLYRPSQDCSLAYGHAVSINRVDVLSDDDYRETAVHRITPGWRQDILRVHTFGRSGRLRVIDCLVSQKQRRVP